MDRYSCAFNGTCEPDPNGQYASEEECLLNCESTPDKDINYLILQYAPGGLSTLAPSDQVEVARRLTGVVFDRNYVSVIVEALANLDWSFLAKTVLRDWVIEELGIPESILTQVLEARASGDWRPLRDSVEAIPYLREADQAVTLTVQASLATYLGWNDMTTEQLNALALPSLNFDLMRYGDIVGFRAIEIPYNKLLTVYDGKTFLKIVGWRLPDTILVNDFPITTYFRTALEHLDTVWLDPTEFVLTEGEELVSGNLVKLVAINEDGDESLNIYTTRSRRLRRRWVKGEVMRFESSGRGMVSEEINILDPDRSLFDVVAVEEWYKGDDEE